MGQTGANSRRRQSRLQPNPSKHGILSDAPVVLEIGEVYKDWERHRVGTIGSLDAEGHIEIVLAERIANLFWRIKHLERYERPVPLLHRPPRAAESLSHLAPPPPRPTRRPSAIISGDGHH
jgi:hypothetical protein